MQMIRSSRLLPALIAIAALGCTRGTLPVAPSDPVIPPSAGTALPPAPGLLSAVGGAVEVQLRFIAAAPGIETGLFLASTRTAVFDAPPVAVDPAGDVLVLGGLTPGSQFLGLAVRADAGDPWRPSGPVLEAFVGAPLYVDPEAAPGGDGSSPASAFQNPVAALVTASIFGGNVWLRGGDYGPVSLPVFDGTFLSGGFGAAFDLETRDPESQPSVLGGGSGQAVIGANGGRVVLDGLRIDGGGTASLGVDAVEVELDLRSVEVRDCATRGVRVRAALIGDPLGVRLAGCTLANNGGDGFSGQGVLALEVFASRFEQNVQEGLDIDDLVASSGATARLTVLGSVFESNGAEGLDVDLAAGDAGAGGAFEIDIRDSRFVTNNLAGVLVDIDYEASPAWSLDLEVSGVVAWGNRGDGARFDLDSTSTSFVHRSVFAGNAGDGLEVSSESAAGVAVVSTSSFVGNLGAGLRASLGNVPVLASHCVLSGNFDGGMRSDTVTSTAASCLTWLQPQDFTGISGVGSGAAAAGDLLNVAQAFLTVEAAGVEVLDVDQPNLLTLGVDAELAGDDVAREVVAISGSLVELDVLPAFVGVPTVLAAFGFDTGVVEDHRLVPGASVSGDGMVAPGAAAVDPGPHGAPDGAEPGPIGPLGIDAYRLARVFPAPIGSLASDALVRLEFDRPVLGATADDTSVRVVDGAGVALDPIVAVVGGAIELTAPIGGWPAVVYVDLDRQLSSDDGVMLTAPVRVAFGG
ncbi:right-handed parallel beta-helix repeat-containing protein [Engelhardtia mirabilis]|uniref:Right handed beta helix domain-containing protein n=1 Tax=Engelhardtia mirabilis TaxID=2528011 RepID=A0A518BDP8_9BACT|nr:hypothetical protein Pla133_01490 [Planctomycetes bacterium Pla133]QDU99412.1 hypothetical protein Pla86_01490 [Planctomycetes bacterium Pla86]